MKKTKIGIVGCGNISGIYFTNGQMLEILEVAACADLVAERAAAKAKEFNVPKACSVEKLLADPAIEIVVNLTIPKAHAEVALAALNAGKHVYGEKPLAFNRADGSEEYDSVAPKLPRGPNPQASDLASLSALQAFQKRIGLPAPPAAQVRARYTVNGDGSLRPAPGPPPVVRQAITRSMQQTTTAYHPDPIRVPALALYAVPKSASDLMRPWYSADDPAIKDNVAKLLVLARESYARHARWFQELAPGSRVAEIAGDHYLFISNPSEVLHEISDFLASLR